MYTEPELLLRIAKGDQNAFAKLVEPIFDRLFSFALSVTKSEELAEEVVQDVFLKIWQYRKDLATIDNLTAWIYTITRNLSYNVLRKQMREPQLARQLDAYFTLAPASAADNLLFQDTLALVEQAASTLTPQQEVVFRMNRMKGFSLDEVAEQLKLSKETVKKHLTLALKTVRAYVQAHSIDILIPTAALLWQMMSP